MVLPPTVTGFFLLLIFGRRSFIGRALEHIGISIAFSWPATVIAATVIAFPLMYRTTLGAFEQVNPTLLEAARTLGANEWVVFWRVLLPLAGPGVIAGTVLACARALGEFGATLMLAGNIPGRTQTMPIGDLLYDGGRRDAARPKGRPLPSVLPGLTDFNTEKKTVSLCAPTRNCSEQESPSKYLHGFTQFGITTLPSLWM